MPTLSNAVAAKIIFNETGYLESNNGAGKISAISGNGKTMILVHRDHKMRPFDPESDQNEPEFTKK